MSDIEQDDFERWALRHFAVSCLSVIPDGHSRYRTEYQSAWETWQYLSARSEQAVTLQPTNAWQFFQDGEWRVGSNLNNHKQNTIDGGYPVRDLYVPQSTESETQGDLQRTDDKQDQAGRGLSHQRRASDA